ncbi:DUF3304 domain-containing protein [Massilia sp. S19_KUP03_FR1]|uniref:DUF3304 domain-containing protein n=1 Tax=Massilia sp. S19_KUP03_FR1 TaxID=3025503 RepID=UPI002FCD7236
MVPVCSFKLALKKMLIASLLLTTMLSACGRPGSPVSSDVPVSVHAVNYSDEEFQYTLEDPADPSNLGGGEAIGRFAAGGTMCCYSLPKKWRPGMKVKLNFELYFPNPSGGDARKTKNTEMVDIPQYINPEELWLVRAAHGEMSIVLSNVQPDHPKWTGPVKGWPVPTLAYYRERADIYINNSKGTIDALQELSKGMRSAPEETAKGMWELNERYDRKANFGYAGYKDKKYQEFLRADFDKSLAEEKENLKLLEANRP